MRLLLLFLIFIICFPSVAQSWEQEIPLTRTQLHQRKLMSTEEWTDYRKTDYSYDHYNRETGQKRWRNTSGGWILSSVVQRIFDENGAQDSVIRKYYNLQNGELRFEIISNTDYENGNLVLDHYTLEDLEDGSIEERRTEITYDMAGNVTEHVEMNIDDTGFQSGSRFKQTFNEQGCRVSQTNAQWINRQWFTFDSSYFEVDASCEILQWEYYFSNSLQFRQKYETLVDDAGRVKVKFTFSKEAGDTVWRYFREEQYEYDESGNNTSYYIRYYDDSVEVLNLYSYDRSHRLTRQTRQYKGFSDEVWVNYFEYIAEYTEEGNIQIEIFRNNWDDAIGTYANEYKTEAVYYEKDLIMDVTYTTTFYSDIYSQETVHFNYRCDNALMERTNNIIISPVSWELREDRYKYKYYHTAPCENFSTVETDIKLFPNPATDYIHVISSKPYGRSVVSLITSTGRVKVRKEMDLSNYFSLDIAGLDTGIYILKIQSPEGEFERRLMVR